MEEINKITNRKIKSKKENAEMSFVEHLDSFRKRLIRGVIAIVFFAIVAFFFKDFIFNQVILAPKTSAFISNKVLCLLADKINAPALCINQSAFEIINIDLAGQFKAHIIVSLIFGFIVAFPFLVHQLWKFLVPALKHAEFVYAKKMVFWVSFLFSFGVIFGYFVIVPLAINFLATYSVSFQINNTINFASYFSSLTTTSLGTGLVFEIPVAAYVLAKIGIINPKIMKKYRKHAIVVSFFLATVVTPPDAFSMVLVAFPILLLYEISIGIVKRVAKKRVVSL